MHKLHARTLVTPPLVAGRRFPVSGRNFDIVEQPLHGIIRIQADASDSVTAHAIESSLGLSLPRPERCSRNETMHLTWVGPKEWLCFCSLDHEEDTVGTLTEALKGQFATVTLVSDSRMSLLVSGSRAREFLSKGCAIDVHPEAFPSNAAVTTRFGGIPAMLLHRSTDEYVIYFDVTMADFVVSWVLDAAAEYLA